MISNRPPGIKGAFRSMDHEKYFFRLSSKVSKFMDNLIKGRKNKRKVGDRSVDPTMISKQNLSPTTHTLEASTISDTDSCKCDDAVKVKAIKEVLEN